jgi:hypothetical protein
VTPGVNGALRAHSRAPIPAFIGRFCFFVALVPARELLLRAKYLFVGAKGPREGLGRSRQEAGGRIENIKAAEFPGAEALLAKFSTVF